MVRDSLGIMYYNISGKGSSFPYIITNTTKGMVFIGDCTVYNSAKWHDLQIGPKTMVLWSKE